jgi:hypothetical protein
LRRDIVGFLLMEWRMVTCRPDHNRLLPVPLLHRIDPKDGIARFYSL